MTTRQDLVDHFWQDIINPLEDRATLQRIVAHCRRQPDGPFAGVGAAIERALSAGVSPDDLCLIHRSAAYQAVFGTLYALEDPGVDDGDVYGLYEELLTSPSARY